MCVLKIPKELVTNVNNSDLINSYHKEINWYVHVVNRLAAK